MTKAYQNLEQKISTIGFTRINDDINGIFIKDYEVINICFPCRKFSHLKGDTEVTLNGDSNDDSVQWVKDIDSYINKILGLEIAEDFVTQSEEQELISHFQKRERKDTEDRNSIDRFGLSVPYSDNIREHRIPEYFDTVISKLPERPTSVSINHYLPKQGITYHYDRGTNKVYVLSLEADCEISFKKDEKIFSVTLPQRSLMMMQGEARINWQHGIMEIEKERISIVFRNEK